MVQSCFEIFQRRLKLILEPIKSARTTKKLKLPVIFPRFQTYSTQIRKKIKKIGSRGLSELSEHYINFILDNFFHS